MKRLERKKEERKESRDKLASQQCDEKIGRDSNEMGEEMTGEGTHVERVGGRERSSEK